MIHILHTADLHLGKIIFELSLLQDQKHVLNQLLTEVCKKDLEERDFFYSALIISGDIYDRSIPPPEAVELFDEFLTSLRKSHPSLHIFIIPGNHDSAQRLSYASRILSGQNIHIATTPRDTRSFTILEKGEEKLGVFQIPFLSPSFYSGGDEDTSRSLYTQNEILKSVIQNIEKVYNDEIVPEKGALPCIVSAHVFTLGSQTSDSERAFLGTAEIVSAQLFDFFSYTALGHIHKPQKAGSRAYYAGSPLAYSFSEAGIIKSFLHASFDCTSASADGGLMPLAPFEIETIPVIPLHNASRLKGEFNDFYSGTRFDNFKDDYLEINLTGDCLIESPMLLLKTKFKNLLSIRQGEALDGNHNQLSAMSEGRKTALDGGKALDAVFEAFVRDIYPEPESTDVISQLLDLFLEIAKETEQKEKEL